MDNNDSMKPQQTGGLKLMTVFIAVLALHVLVIGGITVYHVMDSGSDADLALDNTHKLKADGTPVADAAKTDATATDKSLDATGTATSAESSSATGTTTASTAPAAETPASATAETSTATASMTSTTTPAPVQVAAESPVTPATPASTPTVPETGTTTAASPIVLSGDDMSQTSGIPAGLIPPPDATPAPVPTKDNITVGQVVPTPAPAPAVVSNPAPAAIDASSMAAAPSGPVVPAKQVASGPVHMPATPAQIPATTVVSSDTEHAPAVTHEEHVAAVAHETRKETYTVKLTDSFQKIAHAHHITVAELKSANHIKGNTLHAGQKLIIPGATKTEVAKSEKTHEQPADASASMASLSTSTATGTTTPRHHFYTVTKGDTLAYIAKKFDVSVLALKDVNNVTSTKQLKVGEKLRIPLKDSRTTETASVQPAPAPIAAPVPVPAPAPATVQPSQVETQPTPVMQPQPTPVSNPQPEPQPTPASNPELANLTF